VHTTLRFRLNGRLIELKESGGAVLIDWLRQGQGLTGTKEGCREGDCGACLVLLGEPPADSHAERWSGSRWRPACWPSATWTGDTSSRSKDSPRWADAGDERPHQETRASAALLPGQRRGAHGLLLAGGRTRGGASPPPWKANLCRLHGLPTIRRGRRAIAADSRSCGDLRTADPAWRTGGVPPRPGRTILDCPRRHPQAPPPRRRRPRAAEEHTLGAHDWFVRHPDPEPEDGDRFSVRSGSSWQSEDSGRARDRGRRHGARVLRSKAVRAAARGNEAYKADVATRHPSPATWPQHRQRIAGGGIPPSCSSWTPGSAVRPPRRKRDPGDPPQVQPPG
jgi:hypothetical protein